MKNLAIARRYAKALLLIGKEDGQADGYRDELSAVARLIAEDQSLEQVLSNPLHDAAARRRVLTTVIERLGLSRGWKGFVPIRDDPFVLL